MKSETIYQIIFAVLADEATDKERHILIEWLNASDVNRAEYDKLKHLYQITNCKSSEKTFDVEQAWLQVRQHTVDKNKTFKFPVWIRYAAMVAMIVSIGMFFFSKSSQTPVISEVNMEDFDQPTLLLANGEKIPLAEESFYMQEKHVVIKNNAKNQLIYESGEEITETKIINNNHLVIPKGKTYQLSLSDGTRIWLNSETEITYPTHFSENKREVKLIGEAYFEVAKDKAKPFIVYANGMEIKVLGTSFNVSCYTSDNIISTTLVEGSVAVKTTHGKTETITPSEQFTYNKENNKSTIQAVDTQLFTSWIEGKYIFKNATLEEIVTKLQHWYEFSIIYEDNNLKNKRYSIVAERNTKLDQLLEVISYTSEVKLERVNNIIHVKREREEDHMKQ